MPFVVGFEPLPEPEDGVEEWIGKVVIQCPDCGGRRWMKVSEDTVNDIRQSVVDSIGDQPTLWPKYQDGQPL
jgi:DNA-directed RNA polymerase subunit RPC12/RpoP